MNTEQDTEIWETLVAGQICYVIFEQQVLTQINHWRQKKLFMDSEACGILLGEIRGDHLRVTHLTVPFDTDSRTPTGYRRNIMGHQKVVSSLHKMSDGRIHYLGEWHTHPQRHATPSSTDYREWSKTLNFKNLKHLKLIFFIAGTDSDWMAVTYNKTFSVGRRLH